MVVKLDIDHYRLVILSGIQRKPMYAGTVPIVEVGRRRAKNKRARAARRINRPA